MSSQTKMRSLLATAAVAVLLACAQGAVADDAKNNTLPVTPPKSPQELQQRIESNVNNYWQSKQNAYDAWHRQVDVGQAARERAVDNTETARELNTQARIMDWQNNQQAWTSAQAEALSALEGVVLLEHRICQRTSYRRSFSEGRAVFELPGDAKSAQEFYRLAEALYPLESSQIREKVKKPKEAKIHA
ncbi:MAG: hypothetical protein HQL62_06985 [Magnetococcales bacterium]|nr:hypothetical protein [Magnetococcales bacterium]